MSNLLTHCGSKCCSLEQLLTIPESDKTKTYTPLNHYDFAVNVRSVTSDFLRDFTFVGDDYALNSDWRINEIEFILISLTLNLEKL